MTPEPREPLLTFAEVLLIALVVGIVAGLLFG